MNQLAYTRYDDLSAEIRAAIKNEQAHRNLIEQNLRNKAAGIADAADALADRSPDPKDAARRRSLAGFLRAASVEGVVL